MLSLVVPGLSDVRTLFSPIILFINVDFPTFGLPIKEIIVFSFFSKLFSFLKENLFIISSRSLFIPSPLFADMGQIDSMPSL